MTSKQAKTKLLTDKKRILSIMESTKIEEQ